MVPTSNSVSLGKIIPPGGRSRFSEVDLMASKGPWSTSSEGMDPHAILVSDADGIFVSETRRIIVNEE